MIGQLFERLRRVLRVEAGASVIEMTLVMILLLSLVAGIVDLGGAFQNFIIITNAAREGARTAARLPCKADNRTAIRNEIIQATIDETAGTNVTLTGANVTIDPDPNAACAAAGTPIRVTVEIQYTALLGQFLGFNTFPVRSSAAMAYSGNDTDL